jgi:hypothetical protein
MLAVGEDAALVDGLVHYFGVMPGAKARAKADLILVLHCD